MKQSQFRSNSRSLAAGFLLSVFGVVSAFSQTVSGGCGNLRPYGQYGPYDARTDLDKLPIVLGAHFTPVIEALISGDTNRHPGGDIDYTLRAIPNYHRALIAIMRLGERDKTDKPRDTRYTVECWFLRAIAFRPDDAIVRMIYSTYLNSKKRTAEANIQLEIATGYAKENAFTHYNIGLHYFDLKNYERSLTQAHKAYGLGFEAPNLRDQLKSVGKWKDPDEKSPEVGEKPVGTDDKK